MALILLQSKLTHPPNCIKNYGLERPFEQASKVPNVVAQRGATKEGPFHGEGYLSGFGFGQVDVSSSRHRRKRESLGSSYIAAIAGSALVSEPSSLLGMEACASAHHWACEIAALGHSVRMMPPAYVKPYVKRNKTDVADSEAICEAVTRPTMRFVPVKTDEQQAAGMILRTREVLIRQRSQTANALRAHMAELSIIAGTGMASIAKLLVLLRDEKDNRTPGAARFALIQFAEQIELLTTRIENFDREILVFVRKDPMRGV